MSRFEVTRIRMYRFHDEVAITFERQGETTETLYMQADLAYMVAAHFQDIAEDIKTVGFTSSVEGTWLAEVTPAGASIRKEEASGVP